MLIAAFAISLLVHFVLAGYVRWPVFEQRPAEPVAKVRILHIARIPRPTPPRPTPAPSPAATPAVHASVAPPPLTPRAGKGTHRVTTIPVRVQTPAPRVTSLPTPAATATSPGPCGGQANTDPTVASTPDAADLTPEARASKVSGTAAVHVALDASGRVTDATVAQSSGNAGLDAAAVQMARNATYTPRYAGCKAVAGEYTFTVKFVAW